MEDKIANLKKLLGKLNLDALLIPMQDAYNSEYVADYLNRIKYISNFTGSNAYIIFLKDQKAKFFTDGRYSIQAKLEVDNNFFDIFDFNELTPIDFFKQKTNLNIGFDGEIHSISEIKKLQSKGIRLLEEGIEIQNFFLNHNIRQPKKIIKISTKQSGLSIEQKINQVIKNLNEDSLLLTDPTSICWLLNIRGFDLENTPVVFCYAILHKSKKIDLFLDMQKLEKNTEYPFDIQPLQDFPRTIQKLKSVRLDAKKTSYNHYNLIKNLGIKIFEADDIVENLKCIKNETEIKNIKKAHKQDARAIKKFISWLKKTKQTSELEVEQKLLEFRKQCKDFICPSFSSICGFNENGAIIHYKSSTKTNKVIKANGILLIDSGGQYKYGTTDVTRVFAIGKPTKKQKFHYTLILKAHIALATCIFPVGTTGSGLDAITRNILWQNGLDFAHGTGHGVGYFLNVHEGPASISKRSFMEIKEGMVLSNEPGLYFEGEYGIRIENLVLVKKSKHDGFLEFKNLTLIPYEKKLIDYNMLNKAEINYIRKYV
jgi:Xaa-Pro aminopeptidase